MLRKTLTILSLIGLLLSVGAWAISFGDGGFSISMNNYFYWAIDTGIVKEVDGL
ncbi:MAG: hypothetical protein IIA66_13635 [Planctomycetes bacterium]|nr:hypothetical protein [Planctomycetota bacterium]